MLPADAISGSTLSRGELLELRLLQRAFGNDNEEVLS